MSTLRTLAAEARSAAIGALVVAAIPVVGAVFLAALAGDVPAWTLALALAIPPLLIGSIASKHSREVGRLEGSLESEIERREAIERESRRLVSTDGAAVQPATSAEQDGFLFRIKSLRGDMVQRQGHYNFASRSQARALHGLAKDIREHVGQTASLDAIVEEWGDDDDYEVDDAITALGQLEGLVIGSV